jgi:hypothetical protein
LLTEPKIAQATNNNLSPMQQWNLSYQHATTIIETTTPLDPLAQYSKYHDNNGPSTQENKILYLSGCSKILGSHLEEDNTIKLGHIYQLEDQTDHYMALYRSSQNEKTDRTRVDYITALAAKKSIQAANQGNTEESLQNAFIFGVLRGHNTRSYYGACWAMNMSMRWLLAYNQLIPIIIFNYTLEGNIFEDKI